MRATFDADGIVFARYPFPPASIYPHGRLVYSSVRDVDPDAGPPEVRTHQGETLFISAEHATEFRTAIAEAQLAVVRRVDVWDLLLEPFLDTEFTADDQERTMATLQRLGISRLEVSEIRRSVQNSMLAYNGMLWDWVHLGLFDLLIATRWPIAWAGFVHRLFPKRYGRFYWRAMELADHGRDEFKPTGQSGEPEPPGTRVL
jgi:hypothetical protein